MLIKSHKTTKEIDMDREAKRKKRTGNKAVYIKNMENVPGPVLDGIHDAIENARGDFKIGMYSYFFTSITRPELSQRYLTKCDEFGFVKTASISYIKKHVIMPVYESITTSCECISTVSTTKNYEYDFINITYMEGDIIDV